jgi:hypothetical protein
VTVKVPAPFVPGVRRGDAVPPFETVTRTVSLVRELDASVTDTEMLEALAAFT